MAALSRSARPRSTDNPGVMDATLGRYGAIRRASGRLLGSAAVCASALCAAACAAPTAADPAQAAIERLIGDAPCDHDGQCRTLPIGHKACGGPERWLPWSTKATDEARLHELLARAGSGSLPPPARPQGYSLCVVVPDPGAVCQAGRCVLREGPAAAR